MSTIPKRTDGAAAGKDGNEVPGSGGSAAGAEMQDGGNPAVDAGMPNGGRRVCRIGDTASLTKTFTEEDIRVFTELTLDDNGMHTDPALARRGIFRRPVVHGVLVGSMISSVMGTKLPGHGTILQDQQIEYLAPVYPGDTVTATVTLVSVEESERYYMATLEGTCCNQDDVLCVKAVCRQMMLKRFFEIAEPAFAGDK